ncbi:MAG: PAS domain S-box protein [Desulfomonile tiedjei]|nr:PAS domain S-box protein [Desulfomonile tiedjei]
MEQALKPLENWPPNPGTFHDRLVELRSAQIRQLYSVSVPGMVGAQITALALTIALWDVVSPRRLLAWLAVYFSIQIVRFRLVRRFQRSSPSPADTIPWGVRFARIIFVYGLSWGMAGIFLFPDNSIPHQLLLTFFMAGVGAAALAAYSPLKACYLPTICAECIPVALRCFYEFDFIHLVVGILMLVYCAGLVLAGDRVRKKNEESLRLGFEKNDLLLSVMEKQQEAAKLNEELLSEIQERNRAQQAFTESEARYRELAELLPQLIFELDLNGNFTFVNRAGLDMMGRSARDLAGGLAPSEIWAPEDWDRAHREFGGVFAGMKMAAVEYNLKTVQGVDVPVIVYANPFTRHGKIVGVRGVGVDVSELKATQNRLISSLEEKEVLMREIHHRVKNNLQVVCSLLRVQRRTLDDGQFASILKESENRIVTMASAYEKLYQSPNISELNAADYLGSLVRHVHSSYETAATGIEMRTKFEDLTLTVDSAISLGLIATELVSNCLKHAFPHRPSGRIEILLHSLNDGQVELKVCDSGIGFSEKMAESEYDSLGLRLVRIFAQQLRGELKIANDGGTTVSVRFHRADAKQNQESDNAYKDTHSVG